MAGIKPMQPLGQVGFQVQALLPLHLGPAGIEEDGQLGVKFEKVGLVLLGVVKLIKERPGVGVGSHT